MIFQAVLGEHDTRVTTETQIRIVSLSITNFWCKYVVNIYPDETGERDNGKDKAPRVQRRHLKKRHRPLSPGSACELDNLEFSD